MAFLGQRENRMLCYLNKIALASGPCFGAYPCFLCNRLFNSRTVWRVREKVKKQNSGQKKKNTKLTKCLKEVAMSLDLPGEDVVGGLALASSHAPTQPFGHSPSAGCREK